MAAFLWLDIAHALIALAALGWFAVYWTLFAQRYLRLPAARLVALVVLGLAALFAVVTAATVHPNDVGMLIYRLLPGWE